jgi:poly-gamma-glutamate capsule biosynthesis protein CapA/YwtB (metallophosphatase superfamily)
MAKPVSPTNILARHKVPVQVPCAVVLATLAGTIATSHSASSAKQQPSVTVVAVGDILLDRGVAQQIEKHGLHYPFARTRVLLSGADLAFGNLECPITQNGNKVMKPFCFKAKPQTASALKAAGLDVLSLANNHTLDCNRSGLVETMQNLQRQKLRWSGAGSNRKQAEAATITTINGLRVAWLSFSEFIPEGVFLRDDKPSIALASPEAIQRSVTQARKQAQIVIVSLHWGVEYAARPRANQTNWAKIAVDNGADLVLGHHPHVLQGLQVQTRRSGSTLRRSLVAYSLGNFVFDSPRAWDKRTAQTMILRCTFDRNGLLSAEVVPIIIQQSQPRPANLAEAQTILRDVAKLSNELGTRLTGRHIRF